jgi:hypothetical protein
MRNQSWKNNIEKTRYVMDAILFIGFVLVCTPKATGIVIHEWASLLFIVPLIVHLLLHWNWMKTLPAKFKRSMSGQNRFNTFWDFLFYIIMLLSILSGFLVSEALLPQLGLPIEIQQVWSMLHHNVSNLLMPMLGIHLALHWKWIKSMTKRMGSRLCRWCWVWPKRERALLRTLRSHPTIINLTPIPPVPKALAFLSYPSYF